MQACVYYLMGLGKCCLGVGAKRCTGHLLLPLVSSPECPLHLVSDVHVF